MPSISGGNSRWTPTLSAPYTQTYSTGTRTHALGALSESVVVTLLTDVPALLNSTNATVNELKKLLNAVIDDLQANGVLA